MKTRSIGFLASVLWLAGCASVPSGPVPETLKPSPGESLALTVSAKGAQIYECRDTKDGYAWVFIAPDAALFNEAGQRIGHHGAGPYWQASDGSRVIGTVKARSDAPVASAIPWLLLSTKSTGTDGAFSKVTSIQRVNTIGGLAPQSGCIGKRVGVQTHIDYRADYRLFVGN